MEEAYEKEAEELRRQKEKKRKLLMDDVPDCLKRSRGTHYVKATVEVEKKLGPSFCRALMTMVATEDLPQ